MVTDDTVVEMTVGELTAALATALKAVAVKVPKFTVGESFALSVTVSGVHNNHVNLVLDGVPDGIMRSFTFPAVTLAAAVKAAE